MENIDTAKVWQENVRAELLDVIDKVLAPANTGGWAIKYKHPITTQYEDGSALYDTKKISGIELYIQFDFESALEVM